MSSGSLLIYLASSLLCLRAIAADHVPVHLADDNFIRKQICIYDLLRHVGQAEALDPKLYEEGKSWDIKANSNSYNSSSIVTNFLETYENGMLPSGEIFSLYYAGILDETVALYRLFYNAIDFKTFRKTAAWARIHLNEWQFAYAFSVAVIHRPDTKYIKLPPIYEINPYHFCESDVIHKAHLLKMSSARNPLEEPRIIIGNHSLWYGRSNRDREQELNYFMEDIDLNAFYYTLNLEYPFWLSGDELNPTKLYRGEQYLYTLKQLLARYYLERLSNDMDEIEDIDWHVLRVNGYHPFMTYSNGLPFPERAYESAIPLNKRKLLQEVRILESRILAAIDTGYILDVDGKMESIYTPEGFHILGNIIEGNEDSYNKQLYGSIDALARNILGFNPDPLSKYQILPSALQHYSTSLRDPIFYRLMKKIVGYFERYKSNIKSYTGEELGESSGLEIESVIFDKLETYMDHADVTLDNAISVHDNKDAVSSKIKVRQYRLNHKPFSCSMGIKAENDTVAMIRVFLGPKNEGNQDPAEIYKNFYEFDMWKVNLTAGKNTIKRSSHQALFVAPDQEDAEIVYAKLKYALTGENAFTYTEHVNGFPERMLLPKGKREGLSLQAFVHVVPLMNDETFELDSPVWGKATLDGRPLGFPLDRPMLSKYFKLLNMHTQDVVIFHKEASEINATI